MNMWPDFSNGTEDFDIGGPYNYVFHRYNMSFKNNFVAMLYSTPTYKKRITYKLCSEYIKTNIHDNEKEISILMKYDLDDILLKYFDWKF